MSDIIILRIFWILRMLFRRLLRFLFLTTETRKKVCRREDSKDSTAEAAQQTNNSVQDERDEGRWKK